MWSVWSDDKKSGISEKFSCCLLREGTEDCPSDKKVPCLVILRPLFVSGDTLCSVVLFVMAGLLLIDIGVIIWTTRLFHRKKHQVRKDLEKDAAEESMSGAEAIRKSHKDKNLKKERKGAELKANSDS